MRFIMTKDLKPGMIVGKTFYSNSMSVLLRKGILLSETHIRSINRINISGIYIDDEMTRDIVLKPLIDDDLKLRFAKEVKTIFTSVRSKIRYNNNIDDIIKTIMEQISSKSGNIVNMLELKTFDNYTFQHSINVCILSIVVGMRMKLSYHVIHNLALAAIYHDIGKMFIDSRILNKKGKLTDDEFAIMQNHTQLGVDYINRINLNRQDIAQGVLQHHERHDGSGYPNELSGDKISLFAKILAISDVFDAITSEHPYRPALLPSDAIEYIMSNAAIQFDYELACLFINCVSAYPVGITVKLSNGLTGIVAENYEGFTLRPLIKVLPDDPGQEPWFINLKDDMKAQSITIVEVAQ